MHFCCLVMIDRSSFVVWAVTHFIWICVVCHCFFDSQMSAMWNHTHSHRCDRSWCDECLHSSTIAPQQDCLCESPFGLFNFSSDVSNTFSVRLMVLCTSCRASIMPNIAHHVSSIFCKSSSSIAHPHVACCLAQLFWANHLRKKKTRLHCLVSWKRTILMIFTTISWMSWIPWKEWKHQLGWRELKKR